MAFTSPQTEKLTGKIGDCSPLLPVGLSGLIPWNEKGTVSLTLFYSAYAHFRGSVKWFHGDSPRITPQGTWADHCFVDYTIITAPMQAQLVSISHLPWGLLHPLPEGQHRRPGCSIFPRLLFSSPCGI